MMSMRAAVQEARGEAEIGRVDGRITSELLAIRFDQTSRKDCRVPETQIDHRRNSRDLQKNFVRS